MSTPYICVPCQSVFRFHTNKCFTPKRTHTHTCTHLCCRFALSFYMNLYVLISTIRLSSVKLNVRTRKKKEIMSIYSKWRWLLGLNWERHIRQRHNDCRFPLSIIQRGFSSVDAWAHCRRSDFHHDRRDNAFGAKKMNGWKGQQKKIQSECVQEVRAVRQKCRDSPKWDVYVCDGFLLLLFESHVRRVEYVRWFIVILWNFRCV